MARQARHGQVALRTMVSRRSRKSAQVLSTSSGTRPPRVTSSAGGCTNTASPSTSTSRAGGTRLSTSRERTWRVTAWA